MIRTRKNGERENEKFTESINVITNGTKIMELKYVSFTIRDSALFLPMPLSQFPAAFNLTELKKGNVQNIYPSLSPSYKSILNRLGLFPFKFNKRENWNFIGPFVDTAYY
jgi:hypothetical protein